MRRIKLLAVGLLVVVLAAFASTAQEADAAVCLSCTNESCADGPSGTCQCSDGVLTTCYYRGLPQANRNCTAKAEE